MVVLGAVAVAVLLALASFPISLALTRFFMFWNKARNIVGVDAHKLDKPKIPEMCGISVPITLLVFATIYWMVQNNDGLKLLSYCLVVGSAAIVGAIDDRLKMRGIYKPILTLLCGLPILLVGLAYPGEVYNSTLHVPIFGSFRLPVIYPLTILVAISVSSNTVNMLDPLNGSMSGGITIVSVGLLIGLVMVGSSPTIIFLYASLAFALLGFYYYNKFPARAFAGNVGQLSIGASIGALAILGKTEIASIVAIFPNIQNSFFFLSKIRRFTEHRKLTVRPTRLLPDGRLSSSEEPQAPLTLVRTILVGRPASELDVVHTIFALFVSSSTLAIITILLTG
jgi:UDP-N-acetylglucosamine--dolichyl-phosphate N-acetylglucosaminephosphotransferase